MNLKVKYTTVVVKDPEEVRKFLSEALGFQFWRTATITDGITGIITGISEEDENCLVLVKDTGDQPCADKIIIHTDDCLQDYYELLDNGINRADKPQYTPLGLAFELEDPAGNLYTILEERNYIEN